VKKRNIGGVPVSAIGLGCMGMSFAYSGGVEEENLAVLNRALELGIDHWDTADLYGAGGNERLLAKVLATKRDQVFLATKFGNVTDRTLTSHQDLVEKNAPWIVDGTPAYVRKCCERSLERLGVETIDLYYQHRVDTLVPIEDTIGEMARLKDEGKIRFLGLSEAGVETIQRAHRTHPISALQTEYSLWTRDVEPEILPAIRKLGIAFVPYSPLGRGFLTGEIKSPDDLAADDWRRTNPRFQRANFEENMKLVDRVKEVAKKKGVKPGQVALAWVLAQGEDMHPIPGTKRINYLEENAAAVDVEITKEDEEALAGFEAQGTRYAEPMMAFLGR
jgi:aryl-alcohol dehydrogenase-like predicted oxidoreductase